MCVRASAWLLTLDPGTSELEGVDELRVETRCHLNAHTAAEEQEVEDAQVGLLVPWHLVLLDEAGDDGVGSSASTGSHVGQQLLAMAKLSWQRSFRGGRQSGARVDRLRQQKEDKDSSVEGRARASYVDGATTTRWGSSTGRLGPECGAPCHSAPFPWAVVPQICPVVCTETHVAVSPHRGVVLTRAGSPRLWQGLPGPAAGAPPAGETRKLENPGPIGALSSGFLLLELRC